MRDSHRLEVIRGRQGRLGIRGITFSSFLDIVWAEIWGDCPPMVDHATYHDIVTKLFIDGLPPNQITYKDAKGKIQRLSTAVGPDGNIKGNYSKSAIQEARDMALQLKQAREAARVTSSDDG